MAPEVQIFDQLSQDSAWREHQNIFSDIPAISAFAIVALEQYRFSLEGKERGAGG